MSGLDAVLVSFADRDQRAYRMTNYRHRRLVEDPIAIVPWQLGGESFTLAAAAYGNSPHSFDLTAAGQPLNRDVAFEAMLPFARYFIEHFEEPWSRRRAEMRGVRKPRSVTLAPEAPSILVPNRGAVKLLSRIGRRLAYLPIVQEDGGPPPAAPELVRFGRHLQFIARHYLLPGQQVLVDAVTLCTRNWATVQNPLERENLAAIDAWIDPPHGMTGFEAAAAAEVMSVGPIPNPDDEADLAKWMEDFNRARAAGDKVLARRMQMLIAQRYRLLTEPTWELMWRVHDRELAYPEEPRYVQRRVDVDINEYSRHMEWMDGPQGGRRRTRDTVRQAIRGRRAAESATTKLEAEEATSDALRMIPYLLDHKAVEGDVISYDPDHHEVKPGNQRPSSAPLVLLRTDFPSLMPAGKEVWWAEEPEHVQAVVEAVWPDDAGPGSIVRLKIMSGVRRGAALANAERACFSVLSTQTFDFLPIPDEDPFTHVQATNGAPEHIEPEGDAALAGARGTG